MSIVAIAGVGIVALMYLLRWLLALGLWKHKEARLSMFLAVGGTLISMLLIKYLQFPFLDFKLDDGFSEVYKQVSLALGASQREVCAPNAFAGQRGRCFTPLVIPCRQSSWMTPHCSRSTCACPW